MGLGTMLACIFALVYLLILSQKEKQSNTKTIKPIFERNTYADIWEALIVGIFMLSSLAIGNLLKLDNPYWIPISCAAVMQGASLYHIRQRTFQRILGTFVGLGLTWCLFNFINYTPLSICISIIVLQLIIEMLVVKQYAFAVVFITPFTVLLNEAANPIFSTPDTLIALRFWEIVMGSILGALGGWVLHKEKIRYASINQLEKIVKRH